MRVLLGLLLVAIVGCGDGSSPPGGGAVPTPEGSQAKAGNVAALKKLGSLIERNEQGEVVEVDFAVVDDFTDAGLVHLKGLTSLQTLNLSGSITDAGLVHLKGLTGLQLLWLSQTQITDAGLVHLKGLDKLQTLYLNGTSMTDAGVRHLKELKQLVKLFINATKLTDAGRAELKRALPDCMVVYE